MMNVIGLSTVVLVACAGGADSASAPADAGSRLLDGAWQHSRTGRFQCWHDMRDLYVIYHPFADSTSGHHGMWRRKASIPETWQAPYTLSFYCSDDYTSDEKEPPTRGPAGHDIYPGHRFKQVLIDDRVIWESDVADVDDYGHRELIRVDLTPHVKPGQPFTLALRVMDKVGTDTPLKTDFFWLSTYVEGGPGKRPVEYPFNFRTYTYWGDMRVADRNGQVAITAPRPRPSTLIARQVHERRWPLPPYGEPLPPEARLELQTLARIPASGFPATCGVPLPAGKVRDGNDVTLHDNTGKIVPLQTSVLNRWRDGSIRWLLLDFEATAGSGDDPKWTLQLTTPSTRPRVRMPVRVEESDGAVQITTGTLSIKLGESKTALIDEIRRTERNEVVATAIGAHMTAFVEEKDLGPTVQQVVVQERGPVRATVEVRGTLTGGGSTFGRFTFRVHAYAGKSYLKTFFRIFNDTGDDVRVREFGLLVPAKHHARRRVAWGEGKADHVEVDRGEVVLSQPSDNAYTVDIDGREHAKGHRADGWLSVADGHGTVLVAVRDFWEQYPKALRSDGDQIRIDLSTPTSDPQYYVPHDGEAKRHEILLGFFDGPLPDRQAGALAAAFQSPPRLMDKVWFCKSGGFGYAHWRDEDHFAEMAKIRQADIDQFGWKHFGLRHYGDSLYGKDGHTWRNSYYEVQQGLLAEYLMSGDRRWFDRFAASCRHVQDVDACHHSATHPQRVGLIHTLARDHSIWGGAASAWQRGIGLCMHWRLTGDPDSRDAFMRLAEAIVRTNHGHEEKFSRHWAGPVTTLIQAYDETWDPKWADACRRRVTRLFEQVLDPRRGVHNDRHGHQNYRGLVPWMNAQVARPVYLYYRLTGDFQAADALVGLAEAMIEEGLSPDHERKMWGYSTNPRFVPVESYNVLIAPAILYAYELTEQPAFLAAGRLLYRRAIETRQIESPHNCSWNTPTLLYYLNKHQGVAARLPDPRRMDE